MINYIVPIITIGLIVASAFLVRNAKKKNSTESYALVLVSGVITFLFEPMFLTLYARMNQINETIDGGAIQITSTVVGIGCIIWSIIRMVKLKKGKKEGLKTVEK